MVVATLGLVVKVPNPIFLITLLVEAVGVATGPKPIFLVTLLLAEAGADEDVAPGLKPMFLSPVDNEMSVTNNVNNIS